MKKALLIVTLFLLYTSIGVKAYPVSIQTNLEDADNKYHKGSISVDINDADTFETTWTKIIPLINESTSSSNFEPVPPVNENNYYLTFYGTRISTVNWTEMKPMFLETDNRTLQLTRNEY